MLDHLVYNQETKMVVNWTGCKVPCSFKEYEIVGSPQSGASPALMFKGGFSWGFNIASTDVRVETEELVYPIISFVAELGGSLGLCLGVSFLSSWDLVAYIFNSEHLFHWKKGKEAALILPKAADFAILSKRP